MLLKSYIISFTFIMLNFVSYKLCDVRIAYSCHKAKHTDALTISFLQGVLNNFVAYSIVRKFLRDSGFDTRYKHKYSLREDSRVLGLYTGGKKSRYNIIFPRVCVVLPVMFCETYFPMQKLTFLISTVLCRLRGTIEVQLFQNSNKPCL